MLLHSTNGKESGIYHVKVSCMVVPLFVAGWDLSTKGETLSDVGFCCSQVVCFHKS